MEGGSLSASPSPRPLNAACAIRVAFTLSIYFIPRPQVHRSNVLPTEAVDTAGRHLWETVCVSQMNSPMKQTHRHREHSCGCQAEGEAGGGMQQEFGISRCKLLHRGWKTSFHCTEQGTIQHLVINHNRKEREKECARMYNQVTLLQQKVTQHCKPTIPD